MFAPRRYFKFSFQKYIIEGSSNVSRRFVNQSPKNVPIIPKSVITKALTKEKTSGIFIPQREYISLFWLICPLFRRICVFFVAVISSFFDCAKVNIKHKTEGTRCTFRPIKNYERISSTSCLDSSIQASKILLHIRHASSIFVQLLSNLQQSRHLPPRCTLPMFEFRIRTT